MKTLLILPLLLLANLAHAVDIELVWDANKETDLAGYRIYRNYTTTRPFKLAATVGKVPTYTFTNSTAGRRYYYAITAHNTSGVESIYSNLVRVYLMSTPTNLHSNIIMGSLTIQ